MPRLGGCDFHPQVTSLSVFTTWQFQKARVGTQGLLRPKHGAGTWLCRLLRLSKSYGESRLWCEKQGDVGDCGHMCNLPPTGKMSTEAHPGRTVGEGRTLQVVSPGFGVC